MQSGLTGPALGQVFADIRGTLASLMSSKGTPEGLQRIILSWDFWEIEDNASYGGGVIPDLEALPKSFDSAEVLACPTRASFDVLDPKLHEHWLIEDKDHTDAFACTYRTMSTALSLWCSRNVEPSCSEGMRRAYNQSLSKPSAPLISWYALASMLRMVRSCCH